MTRTISLSALGGAFVAALAIAPGAGAASDKVVSDMGHELAKHYCTGCHLVDPGQSNPPGHVGGPAFQTVADQTGTTKESLRKHLQTTRSNPIIPLKMPNPDLTDDELVKIVSYILSLKTAAKGQ